MVQKQILATVLLGVGLFYIFKDFFEKETQKPGMCPHYQKNCFFSENYYQARAQFRQKALETGFELREQQIPNDQGVEDLTIDVAIWKNKQSKNQEKFSGPVLVHASGTHGVEGYAGSAIQLAFLEEYSKNQKKYEDHNMVLIHAVNPFGFLFNRRFNENNVDLNRNVMIQEQEYETLQNTEDIGSSFYTEFKHIFNPKQPWTPILSEIWFYAEASYSLYVHGLTKLKQALVSGQYTYPQGLYFGGWEQQNSVKYLIQLLKNDLKIQEAGEVIYIDVHSGLGPEGIDTLMIDQKSQKVVEAIFSDQKQQKYTKSVLNQDFLIDCNFESNNNEEKEKNNNNKSQQQQIQQKQNQNQTTVGAGEGYDYLKGSMENLLNIAQVPKGIFITQEFGTVSEISVIKGMLIENCAWWNGNVQQKIIGAQEIKKSFFVDKISWKENIIDRGVILIQQTLEAFQNQEILDQIPKI